jgi:BspA type Leucine rich repeat region (6 copies)
VVLYNGLLKRVVGVHLTLSTFFGHLSCDPMIEGMSLAYTVNVNTVTITGLGTYDLVANLGVLTIPATIDGYPVVAIGVSAFEGPRTDILRVVFPNTLTSVANFAFKNCNALTRVEFSNTSLTTIGDEAFEFCPITSLLFPSTLTSIGGAAFNLCTSLTSVILSNTSLTYIGIGAFAFCPFTSVTLPDTLISIGNYALMANLQA